MDANATTPLLPEVLVAMQPFWTERFGNASSTHQQGQRARGAVEGARESVAGLLGCRGSEVVFTSGGTESDNLALFGVFPVTTDRPLHLITSAIEHHAVLHAAEALVARAPGRVELTVLPCDGDGVVTPRQLRSAMRPNTRLVSIMFANNETGVVQPVAELARIAHGGGALFHTDAVQAAGKLTLDLRPDGPLGEVDLLSIAGHKMYAPQGTGALFVRQGTRLEPQMHGGSHERQRRAGTENVAGVVGLGAAAEHACRWMQEDAAEDGPGHLASLRDRLETALLAAVEGAAVNGGGAARTPNTANLFFEGVDAEALLITLDLEGLACSAGSACQSGAAEPSHVLTAMGLPRERAAASIRLSLSRMSTASEVEAAIRMIPTAVGRLRSIRRA